MMRKIIFLLFLLVSTQYAHAGSKFSVAEFWCSTPEQVEQVILKQSETLPFIDEVLYVRHAEETEGCVTQRMIFIPGEIHSVATHSDLFLIGKMKFPEETPFITRYAVVKKIQLIPEIEA